MQAVYCKKGLPHRRLDEPADALSTGVAHKRLRSGARRRSTRKTLRQ
jgi:hypothetical protein